MTRAAVQLLLHACLPKLTVNQLLLTTQLVVQDGIRWAFSSTRLLQARHLVGQ